jgi:mutator protein MutT
MRVRAVAILIEDNQVAVIERHRAGRHYYTFPGGGVDEGETVEQAVIREVEEELGLRVAVERRVAEVWFHGNRQEYFLVHRIGGEFGTGTGEEYTRAAPDDPNVGTYLPIWLSILDALNQPLLPVEMVLLMVKSHPDDWPEKPVIIFEQEK